MGTISGTVSSLVGAAASAVILLALAVYFSATPGPLPDGRHPAGPSRPSRPRARGPRCLGDGLWHWLQGQLIDMVVVAVLTGLGLWLIGVPLPFVLGLIAGLLNFVPFFGPVLAAIPAALISFDEGLEHRALDRGALCRGAATRGQRHHADGAGAGDTAGAGAYRCGDFRDGPAVRAAGRVPCDPLLLVDDDPRPDAVDRGYAGRPAGLRTGRRNENAARVGRRRGLAQAAGFRSRGRRTCS